MRYMTARQMIFDAYHTGRDSVMAGAIERARLGADIQTTGRRGMDHLIVHGLEAGAVISRVETLPAYLQGLVRYCFGPFTAAELEGDAELVTMTLYRELVKALDGLPGQGNGKPSRRQLDDLRLLCHPALYHHRETTWPYRRQGLISGRLVAWYIDVVMGEQVVLTPWVRGDRLDWSTVWDCALRILGNWEGQGLQPVAALLHEQNKAPV